MGEREVVKGPVNWEHGEQRYRSTMSLEGTARGIIDIASPSLDDYFVANLHYSIIRPRKRTVPAPNSAKTGAYRASNSAQVRHPGMRDRYSG